MLSLRDDVSLDWALRDPLPLPLRRLMADRRSALDADLPFAEQAQFIVVEPGDTIADIEADIEMIIRPDADGWPKWEWVVFHPSYCFETVFVVNDWGYAIVLFIQAIEGMDPELMELVRAACD